MQELDAGELGQVRILPLRSIRPSRVNDTLYKPVDENDPAIWALAKSIYRYGLREPLVVTLDGVLLSGHRRRVACYLAELTQVPCRVEAIQSDDAQFLTLLREYNRQREKSDAEKLREEIVSMNPADAHAELRAHRSAAAREGAGRVDSFAIVGEKRRAVISAAKAPFLSACLKVLEAMREYWPLSDRQIHYQLLNAPPLIHASKPDSLYRNLPSCYKALTDLLTRARLEGQIPMHAIADPTRPVTNWDTHAGASAFVRRELERLLRGYYRDLQQGQVNHIEVVAEKNTLAGILRPVALEYCVPLTIGRGYSSLPPRYDMVERFKKSGRDNLVVLILSDHDPDGEEIGQSFARSLRDDFGVSQVHPVKVALTAQQAEAMQLPPGLEAKRSSANYDKFSALYGDVAHELEAVPPADLQRLLREAIAGVMDPKVFDREVEREKEDAATLQALRRRVQSSLEAHLMPGL